MARVAGREHAVEQIDADRDAGHQIGRTPEAHQIARRPHREMGVGLGHERLTQDRLLAEPESAVGEAVETDRHRGPGALASQAGIDSALDDPEHRLLGTRARALATLSPAEGSFHRGARRRRVARGVEGSALVEGHGDVGPEGLLDRDGALGSELAGPTVDGRVEGDPVLVELHSVAERGHLEAAAVGEPGTAPTGEAREASELLDDRLARALVQMEGVREHDLGAEGPEVLGGHAPHRTVGGHRHEGRGRHQAVGRGEPAVAGIPIGGPLLEAEALGHYRTSMASPYEKKR